MVSILILAMVLYGAALAVSRVNILHQESEQIYTRSYDLRAAINVMGEDVHHSVEFLVMYKKKSSDYASPQGYETLSIKRSRFSTDVVQYHLIEDGRDENNKISQLKLERQGEDGNRQVLLTGLAATSYFDESSDGAAVILLEVSSHPKRKPLTLRSNFFPRGQS